MGGFPSGQRGQTVNLLSYDYDGSNPSPPTNKADQKACIFGFLVRFLSDNAASNIFQRVLKNDRFDVLP
jgi:hypothetical protein